MGVRVWFFAALVALASPLAQAGEDPDSVNEEGVQLYDQGRYAEALALFQQAHARIPRAHFLYNIGRCQQRLGLLDEARDTFETLLAQRGLLKGKYKTYRVKARQALADVEEALEGREAPPVPMVRFEGFEVELGPERQKVRVGPFELDTFEVTGLQYAFCVRAGACQETGQRDADLRLPVSHIPWVQAAAYCRFAKKRLPTEVEWERAARGPRGYKYPWGEAEDCMNGNLRCSGGRTPAPPGKFGGDRTAEGVHDLGGNLSEWVADWFGDLRHPSPGGPPRGVKRTVRGGSFDTDLRFATSDARYGAPPERFRADIGFRCARAWSP